MTASIGDDYAGLQKNPGARRNTLINGWRIALQRILERWPRLSESDLNECTHQFGENLMKSDADIKRDVEQELKWDPDIDATDIGVAVKNGVVTLAGYVRSYGHKYQAERDVKRVSGVVAVANDLEVRLPNLDRAARP